MFWNFAHQARKWRWYHWRCVHQARKWGWCHWRRAHRARKWSWRHRRLAHQAWKWGWCHWEDSHWNTWVAQSHKSHVLSIMYRSVLWLTGRVMTLSWRWALVHLLSDRGCPVQGDSSCDKWSATLNRIRVVMSNLVFTMARGTRRQVRACSLLDLNCLTSGLIPPWRKHQDCIIL